MNKTQVAALVMATIAIVGFVTQMQKSSTTHLRSSSVEQDFAQFIATCNKNYSPMEKVDKLRIFAKNRQAVIDHNTRSGESYTLAINCFADIDVNEFSYKRQLGTLKQSDESKNFRYILGTESLPASVDWRTSNAVTPIKNQGQCGSCWAFSAIGALEGLQAINSKNLLSFSEQQLVDCSTSYGNQGCNGGLMDSAFGYTKDNGITTEDKYAYKGVDGTCTYTAAQKAFQNKGFSDVPANSSAQFQAALASQPVAVAIEADTLGFQLYSTGVFTGKGLFGSCGTNLDHGVLAVGYGVDSGLNYFSQKLLGNYLGNERIH